MSAVQRLRAITARPDWIVNNVLVAALIALIIYFTFQSSAFLTASNLKVMLEGNATLGVVAIAFGILVISGGVDLSVGSTVALSGLVVALGVTEWNLPGGVAILAGVLVGGLVGAINGWLCGVLQLNPVIVTLGMLGVIRGGTLLIHQDEMSGLGPALHGLGNGEILGLPTIGVIALACFALGAVFVRWTTWGRYIYAIGANRDAAYLAALPVRTVPFALYVACGLAAGLAGVLLTARLDGVAPGQQGLNLELQALTVVLLGGVAFAGGRGRVLGVFVGWVFLGVLENGLVLTNVTPFVETLVEGLALVFAASLDRLGAFLDARLQRGTRIQRQIQADVTPSVGDLGPGQGVA